MRPSNIDLLMEIFILRKQKTCLVNKGEYLDYKTVPSHSNHRVYCPRI